MTQEIKSPDAKVRKLHTSVLRWRRSPLNDFFLDEEDFRFAADCERMRVDRNGSTLSLLFVRLDKQLPEDVTFFSRLLEGRIRVTDTPGQLDDGRIAILLPDTLAEGAWKVAADISEVYPVGPSRPECEVLVYPNNNMTSQIEPRPKGNNYEEDSDPSDRPPKESGENATGSRVKDPEKASDEFFFAKSLPLWKRSLDILGGSVGLLLSLPVLAIAAVAVKATSHGPAFFHQRREGQGGKHFTMWKLRTMNLDAEENKHKLQKFSQQDGPAFKMKEDPRTTFVGRLLRMTSMDELPQFWNVLKGDMSLVGPRPLPVEESAACEGWQRRRLQVRPGMTCTWQVCARGNVSFDEWARMDLRYAKEHKVWEDVRLIVMTIPSLLLNKGIR